MSSRNEKQQNRTFLNFLNFQLSTFGRKVNDLVELSTGVELFYFLKALCDSHPTKEFTIFDRREEKRVNFTFVAKGNVQLCLDWLKDTEKVLLHGVNSSDIVDKKMKIILGLVWAIILHFHVKSSESGEKRTKKISPYDEMVNWVNTSVPGVHINQLSDWNTGNAFYNIIESLCENKSHTFFSEEKRRGDIKPDILINDCIKFAHEEFSIPEIISVEEFLHPEKLSITTYMSYFRRITAIKPKVEPQRIIKEEEEEEKEVSSEIIEPQPVVPVVSKDEEQIIEPPATNEIDDDESEKIGSPEKEEKIEEEAVETVIVKNNDDNIELERKDLKIMELSEKNRTLVEEVKSLKNGLERGKRYVLSLRKEMEQKTEQFKFRKRKLEMEVVREISSVKAELDELQQLEEEEKTQFKNDGMDQIRSLETRILQDEKELIQVERKFRVESKKNEDLVQNLKIVVGNNKKLGAELARTRARLQKNEERMKTMKAQQVRLVFLTRTQLKKQKEKSDQEMNRLLEEERKKKKEQEQRNIENNNNSLERIEESYRQQLEGRDLMIEQLRMEMEKIKQRQSEEKDEVEKRLRMGMEEIVLSQQQKLENLHDHIQKKANRMKKLELKIKNHMHMIQKENNNNTPKPMKPEKEEEQMKEEEEQQIVIEPPLLNKLEDDFQKALDGVCGITKSEIREIQSYVRPTEVVEKVLQTLLLLLGRKSSEVKSWPECRKFLKYRMKEEIRNYKIAKKDKIRNIKNITKSVSRESAYKAAKVIGLIFDFLVCVKEVVVVLRKKK